MGTIKLDRASVKIIPQVLFESAQEYPHKIALVFNGQEYTYGKIAARTFRLAHGLASLGIQPRDRVAILLPNHPDFPVAYYAILALGAIVLPLNVMYRAREIGWMLKDAGVQAIVTTDMFLPGVLQTQAELPELKIIVKGKPQSSTIEMDGLIARAPETPLEIRVTENDLAMIAYTSGTMGTPKGAMLTHRNILSNIRQLVEMPRFDDYPDSVNLVALPLFHSFGLSIGLNLTLLGGGKIILMERFDARQAVELIEKYRATEFHGAPPMFIAIANLPDIDQHNLKTLRNVSSGSAPLPVALLERLKVITGVDVFEGYGMTEASPTLASNQAGPVSKPGSVGKPLPGIAMRIVDENDNDVPPGQPGEIVVRGDNITAGYWNLPEETRIAWRDGWFHSGDIGRMDEDGYLYIVGRKKEMIIVSGFNVYPKEIEQVLQEHPAVLEAAVVGVPDAYQGESVCAAIIPKPGVAATEEEIIGYCRQNLAAFKCPRSVLFRTTLPRQTTGKVAKAELRAEIVASLVPSTAEGKVRKGANGAIK
ncbi:MAG: long-chain fatty acid--CoA ligase [Chloroflexi bacterium]|nr:long-chain fatty acid--CoA ligase [Chloroflexota bacterium]